MKKKGDLIVDINEIAFSFNVRARGYDEKAKIIQDVAQEMGRDGIKELARLLGESPERLEQYAVLSRFFEDKTRRRRQRKPKLRISAWDLIKPDIDEEVLLLEGLK